MTSLTKIEIINKENSIQVLFNDYGSFIDFKYVGGIKSDHLLFNISYGDIFSIFMTKSSLVNKPINS